MFRKAGMIGVCVAFVAVLVLVGPAQAVTIANWTFDEFAPGDTVAIDGAVLDSSGNDRHLRNLMVAKSTIAAPSWGTAIEFAGNGPLAFDLGFNFGGGTVASGTDIDLGTADFTIEAVAQMPTGNATGAGIVGKGNSGGANPQLWISVEGTDHPEALYEASGNQYNSGYDGVYQAGEWVHFAMVRDGLTMRFYENGVEQFTDTEAGHANLSSITGDFVVGAANSNDVRNLTGAIAAVRISDVALTPGEFIPEPSTPATINDFTWNIGSGDWNVGRNWTPVDGPPGNPTAENRANHTATFGDKITANSTVFRDTDVTVRAITFDNNTASYNIAGFGNISLVQGTAAEPPPTFIAANQGNHQFQAPVRFHTDAEVNVASASTLIFVGALNLMGHTITKSGAGTMSIRSDFVTGGGTLNVAEGTVTGNGTVGGDLSNAGGIIAPGNGGAAVSGQVPEPGSLVLLVVGGLLMVWSCGRRN